MGQVINLAAARARRQNSNSTARAGRKRTASQLLQAQTAERLGVQIDTLLDEKARHENMPDAVAMAAGRYAVMHLFRQYGRAQTLAFFEDCLQTAEICDDILSQLDDDFM